MIAAVAGALGVTLLDLTVQLAEDFRDIAASDYSARSDAASLLAGSVFAMAA
jgi:hypothetical protein